MSSLFAPFRHLPASVFVLGCVSLLMDLSSETIHALLPLFMVNVLGLSMMSIGIIDALSECVTLALKPVSGWLSDRSQRRKPITVFGYGLSALSKPFFMLAHGLPLIIFARFLDRAGKGIRGAPRDALIADITLPEQRGAAYGLRQSLDTCGALLAPLMAALLMWALSNDYRQVFLIACIPAVLAVYLLATQVKEPEHADKPAQTSKEPEKNDALWPIFLLGGLMALARPPEAFLILRAQDLAFTVVQAPLILAAMNFAYALSAFPVGRIFDRIGAPRLIAISFSMLLTGQLLLAFANSGLICFIAAGFWGLHMGFSQGVLSALLAQRASRQKRARSFGWYALWTGAGLLINGSVVGWLWQTWQPRTAFLFTAGVTLIVLMLFQPILKIHRHTI